MSSGAEEIEHRGGTDRPQALAGRRVLELADESGVYCGKLLADMGADVIKIERPGGDPARFIPPFWGGEPGPNRSLFFLYTNTSKRSITLDLRKPRGRHLFRQLARRAHLIVETFPPGYLDALGLGYASLRELNPELVFTSITGFGQTGPHRGFKCSDLVASALGGALHLTGAAKDPPVALAGWQAFITACAFAAASSLIALYHASRTGKGQRVDISLEECAAAATHVCGAAKWLDDHIVPRRGGTRLFASVPSGAYPCRDGLAYLMVNRVHHWRALARWVAEVTGNNVLLDPLFDGPSANRQPHGDFLDAVLTEFTSRFTVEELYREGQKRHLAITPVRTAAAVAGDDQLAARDFFVPVEHDAGQTLAYPGAPYRLDETPWRIRWPAPRPGQHNRGVYGSELKLTEAEIRSLEEEGVIRSGWPPLAHPEPSRESASWNSLPAWRVRGSAGSWRTAGPR